MMTKNAIILGIFILLVNSSVSGAVRHNVTIYLFWGEGCPHCAAEKPFLDELREKYPSLEVKEYEVYKNRGNARLFTEFSNAYGFTPTAVPTTFIGDKYFVGYSSSISKKIEDKIRECIGSGCPDPWQIYESGIYTSTNTTTTSTVSVQSTLETTTLETTILIEETGGACRITDESCGEEFKSSETRNETTGKCICLTFFYSPTCSHCHRVDSYLSELEGEYPQLKINKFNVIQRGNAKLKEAFDIAFNVPEEKRAYVPAIYIGDKYLIGDSEIIKNLRNEINRYLSTGVQCPCTEIENAKPGVESQIIERFKSFGFLAVMFAGLIDGINPCAFGALVFFISYLAITGRRGKDILLIGISFTTGVFITYLLTGMGLFKFLYSMEEISEISRLIYPLSGIMALIFAIYSLMDWRKAKSGRAEEMSLQLPDGVKKIIHNIIRKHVRMKYLTGIAFFTGIIISLFEFLCTGQVYLPTIIYILGMPELRRQAFLYLVLYNMMFILPLILIFLLAYFGTTSRELSGIIRRHTSTIKILTALLFFILAGYMFLITMEMFGL